LKTDLLFEDMGLMLRPVTGGDDEFVYQVYASTRAAEMALVDWSAEQKEAFLRMQVNAQKDHYQIYYPNAQYRVIQRAGVLLGRLITEQLQDSLLVIDIALLPEHRGAGIGTAVMKYVMNEAVQLNLPVVLRVEFFNPALHLYTRLGFVKTGEMWSIYHQMTWDPIQSPA
jgi:GNAT superfamily N-acetyltransferase